MKSHYYFGICFTFIVSIYASPFELTEKYIASFKNGLQEFKDLSSKYEYRQENLDLKEDGDKEVPKDAKEYDFIVIGAGPSGSAIANRLSEIPEWKVLVLEAGAPETPITQVPAIYPYLRTSPYDWGYTNAPQNNTCLGNKSNIKEIIKISQTFVQKQANHQLDAYHVVSRQHGSSVQLASTDGELVYTWQGYPCLGTIDHKCSIPSGKVLGGNTAVNNMLFTRGNQLDYDIWADLDLKGWCWKDVLPYFKKLEDAHVEGLDRKYHNLGGPVHIENFEHFTKLQPHLLEAGHEIGLQTIDINGKEQLGLGVPQATTKNGRRDSVAKSYLTTANKRANVEIVPNSQVVKILIGTHTKEAYGVKFIHNGHFYVAKAAKEIILAAGAVESPKLLLLSGIGPKEELEPLSIPPVTDLKVGHNLKDHLSFIGLNFVLNDTHHEEVDEKYDAEVDYLKNSKGPLTNPEIEVVGFLKTEASKEKHHYPDIEFLITRDIYNKGHEHLRPLRIQKEIYDAVWAPLEKLKGFTIQVILLHPKSKGLLTLHDKDPLHHPIINTHSLSDLDDSDVQTLLAGIRAALKLAHSESLQKLGVHLNPNKVPGCEHYEKDEYWKCAIKHLTLNLGEISGTAKMGVETDKEAVVDDKLKVFGVHKLRVADASVIPVTISGQLTAPTIMIGEKAADLIKEDWK